MSAVPDPDRRTWRQAMQDRRPVQQVITDSAAHRLATGETLTRRALVVIGMSVLIGAGIFSYTAQSIGQRSGPSTALAFVVAAVACLSTALCYAEISSTVPVGGSAYTYVQTTFGGLAAWTIGWILVLEYAGGAAAVARSWGRYVQQVLPLLGIPVTPVVDGVTERLPAVLLVVALTAALARGGVAHWMRWITAITVLKVAVIVAVVLLGLTLVDPANYQPFFPPAQNAPVPPDLASNTVVALATGNAGTVFGTLGVFSAAAVVFFAYVGFDAVTTAAEEARFPQRDLPRGILFSLGLTGALYVAMSLVVAGVAGYLTLSRPGSTVATAFLARVADAPLRGGVAAGLVLVGALVGMLSVVFILLYGQSRILWAMSRDGLLPWAGPPGRLRARTPLRWVTAAGALALLAAALLPLDTLTELVNMGTAVAFALVAVGTVVLRVRRPDLPRTFQAPALWLVVVVAVLTSLVLVVNLQLWSWLWFALWVLAGLVAMRLLADPRRVVRAPG